MDAKTTLDEMKAAVKKFCEERDWDQYHFPKDLSIGVITEASELLEHFRFKSKRECERMLADGREEKISEEMSDVLFFILRLSQKYNIDLSDAFMKKMMKNEKKYPVEKSRGSNKKYTELEGT